MLGRNLEPASCQKMLDLITEEIPERPGEHQPLLTPALMRDGKNHLHVIDLLGSMNFTRRPSAVLYSVTTVSRMCTGSCMRSASVWNTSRISRPPGARCLRTQSRQSTCCCTSSRC